SGALNRSLSPPKRPMARNSSPIQSMIGTPQRTRDLAHRISVSRSSIEPVADLGVGGRYGPNSAVVRSSKSGPQPSKLGGGDNRNGRNETTTPPGLPPPQRQPQKKEEPIKKKGLLGKFGQKKSAPVDEDFLASLDEIEKIRGEVKANGVG